MKRSSKNRFICLVNCVRHSLSTKNEIVKDFEVECGFEKTKVVLLKIVWVILFSMIFGVDKTIDWHSSLFSPNWSSNLSLKTSSKLLISKSKWWFSSSPLEFNKSSSKSPKNSCSLNSSSFIRLSTTSLRISSSKF